MRTLSQPARRGLAGSDGSGRAGRRLRSTLAAAALGAGLLAAGPTEAGFVYDLTVSGNWNGSGSIEFATLSGNSVADVLDFAFHVATGAGAPQDYDEGDIASIAWTIDAAFNLSLLLTTSVVPLGVGQSGIVLTNQAGDHPVPCVPGLDFPGSFTCFASFREESVSGGGGLTAAFRPDAAVPAPGALALFGLAALACAGISASRRAGPAGARQAV